MAAALRLIPAEMRTVEELRLPPILHEFTKINQGFVLLVGPAGQGKSTSLAALLDEINHKRTDHIITIEDPIEYLFVQDRSIVSQREIMTDSPSFHRSLRSLLQAGPGRGDDRGNARPGDHGHGYDRSRDRSLGVLHPAHQFSCADHRPHHRFVPGRTAGTGHVPAWPPPS